MLTPQEIVDGLRSGNSLADSGQLIDRLAFVACADTQLNDCARQRAAGSRGAGRGGEQHRRQRRATARRWARSSSCGRAQDVVVAIVVRDPSGTNYSPYTFPNPSLAQVGISQPLNKPVLDHIDVIRGLVTGYKTPGAPDYAGQWPSDWITNPNMDNVPAGCQEHDGARCCGRSAAATGRRPARQAVQGDDVPHPGT